MDKIYTSEETRRQQAVPLPPGKDRTETREPEAFRGVIPPPALRTERQRRAWRNAVARRRLEQLREEKQLHRFVTDVWDTAGD